MRNEANEQSGELLGDGFEMGLKKVGLKCGEWSPQEVGDKSSPFAALTIRSFTSHSDS